MRQCIFVFGTRAQLVKIAPVLQLAAEIPIRPEYQEYPLEEANQALVELKRGEIRGAKVLRVSK